MALSMERQPFWIVHWVSMFSSQIYWLCQHHAEIMDEKQRSRLLSFCYRYWHRNVYNNTCFNLISNRTSWRLSFSDSISTSMVWPGANSDWDVRTITWIGASGWWYDNPWPMGIFVNWGVCGKKQIPNNFVYFRFACDLYLWWTSTHFFFAKLQSKMK